MIRFEVAQLYSNRMHRSCVDDAVFNYWMLTNFQSDDAFIPATAAPLLRALIKLDDESAELAIRLWVVSAPDSN